MSVKIARRVLEGMSVQDARAAAFRAFGSIAQAQEQVYESSRVMWLDDLLWDVRYTVHCLWKDRGFAASAFLTLGIGIAATLAMFGVVNAVLIRPLPFPAAERLVGIHERHPQRGWMAIPPANFRDIQKQISAFTDVGAVQGDQQNLALGTGALSVVVGRVGADLFGALRVAPALGRGFASRDLEPDAAGVAIVSYALWQQAWGSSPALLGMTIHLGGDPYTVIGILPPGFSLYGDGRSWQGDVAVWTNWRGPTATDGWQDRQYHHFLAVARLRDGVTIAEAEAQLRVLARQLAITYPMTNNNWTFEVMPLDTMILGARVRPMLLLLMGAATFVLVIGCVNVSNLLFARGSRRRREIAVRMALGCSRSRLIRQLLVETAVLVAGGIGVGLALTLVCAPLLLQVPLATDFPFFPDFNPDRSVAVAVFTIFVFATLAAGILPAWRASAGNDPSMAVTLKTGSTGRSTCARHVLTVGEIGLTVILLAGAGVLIRSFDRLAHVSLGLAPDHVLTARVTVADTSYQAPNLRAAFFQRVLDRIQSLPGVLSAATANYTPITRPGFNLRFGIEGRPPAETGDITSAPLAAVSPSFFSTLRIPLIHGRLFDAHDVDAAPLVLIVNRAFADHFFGTDDPIGRRIRVAESVDGWRTVVGVVGDVRSARLEEGPEATMYAPAAQEPRVDTLLIRINGDPTAASRMVVNAISAIDPQQAISQVRSFEDVVAEATSPWRFRASIVSMFAGLALILAAVGVYGVVSNVISQRTGDVPSAVEIQRRLD